MGSLFHNSLSTGSSVLLFVCLLLVLGFEFVNGFHDTANAVATVIYTNSLRPHIAVIVSGVFNFIGVLVGGIAVAMSIIKLLPVELLISSGPGVGLAMVLSLLLAAIMWNLGTWALGLPSSSSHTLIGSIMGVALANSLTAGHVFGDGVNWHKAKEIGMSLLISPLIGFAAAYILYTVLKRFGGDETPVKDQPPPPITRSVLIGTCSAVSFAHGSNDGQKGVGLVMLILIGLLPGGFALKATESLKPTSDAMAQLDTILVQHADHPGDKDVTLVRSQIADLQKRIATCGSVDQLPEEDRFAIRKDILLLDGELTKLVADGHLGLSADEKAHVAKTKSTMRGLTDYAPTWVIAAIALALGLGTMIGWKRIVVTVGEKIGKSHLTYAQGMSAEIIAASAIGVASSVGLPVSTTHVLSSGIAGTMVAKKSGLNTSTVRNIALAWVFTLPVSMLLAGILFVILRQLFG